MFFIKGFKSILNHPEKILCKYSIKKKHYMIFTFRFLSQKEMCTSFNSNE